MKVPCAIIGEKKRKHLRKPGIQGNTHITLLTHSKVDLVSSEKIVPVPYCSNKINHADDLIQINTMKGLQCCNEGELKKPEDFT